MSVPAFSDIGKKANDLFSKDYPLGQKLEVSTTTANGVKFTTTGSKDKAILAELKAKYSSKGYTVTETWNSSNVLGVQLESQDSITKGLKIDLVASLVPEKAQKNAKASLEFSQSHVFTRLNLDLFKSTIFGDVVVGQQGYVAGAYVSYDVADAAVTKYSTSVGYLAPSFSVQLLANKFEEVVASYYHKVSSDVEAGAKATWQKGESGVAIQVGTKYQVDKDAFVKAKVDQTGRVGLGYSQVLKPGIKLGFGGLFDTARLNQDVHKLGISLTFEA